MLSKIIKTSVVHSFRATTKKNIRGFAKNEVSGSSTTLGVEKLSAEEQHGPTVRDPNVKPLLRDYAVMTYKKYPNVSHNDPNSKDYVHSERDEYADRIKVEAYNKVIDGIKNDIKMQEEVYRIIEKLDRTPHGTPGNTRNVTGGVKDYFPSTVPHKQIDPDFNSNFFQEHFDNDKRWTSNSIFYPKYSPIEAEAEWQKELDNRPVNKHYHHDKGYKYDVEVPWDQRYPHVADRLGYPEILGTTFERLMRLEGEIYHPTYLDQPFVQIPSPDPHPTLNFEEGEVVYENTQVHEWAKFWGLTILGGFSFGAIFVPYSLIYKTHLPLTSAYENLFVPHYNHTVFYFDNLGLHIPIVAGTIYYSTYIVIQLFNRIARDYVVKLQYSKDKELLFVTRVSPLLRLQEEVYEVQHLEVVPPSVKAGYADMSSQDADGLWEITCMNSQKTLVCYNEDHYWNPSLKKEFFDKVMNYWTPDLIPKSRSEQIMHHLTAPKIRIGFETPKLESN